MLQAQTWEIRQIDAYDDGDFWVDKCSWRIGTMKSKSSDIGYLFRQALKKTGIRLDRKQTEICIDGPDAYTMIVRKTQEPILTIVPV